MAASPQLHDTCCDYDPTQWDYLQSLIVMGSIFALVPLVVCLGLLVSSCCVCCGCNRKHPARALGHRRAVGIMTILILYVNAPRRRASPRTTLPLHRCARGYVMSTFRPNCSPSPPAPAHSGAVAAGAMYNWKFSGAVGQITSDAITLQNTYDDDVSALHDLAAAASKAQDESLSMYVCGGGLLRSGAFWFGSNCSRLSASVADHTFCVARAALCCHSIGSPLHEPAEAGAR